MNYIGHKNNERIQLLKEHLNEVAIMSKKFADPFQCGELGFAAGLTHDIGKYSDKSQARMNGEGPPVDHSTAGAKEVFKTETIERLIVALCVASHHTGLLDLGTELSKIDGTFRARLKKTDSGLLCL